jgi:hypothetical protein
MGKPYAIFYLSYVENQMRMMPRLLIVALFFAMPGPARAQSVFPEKVVPYDPALMASRWMFDANTYLFVAQDRFYTLAAGYAYGLSNERHLFSLHVPFIHTIINADFGGLENTTGIGDLQFAYWWVPFVSKKQHGVERVSLVAGLSAPTGNPVAGRGVGTWLFKPGMVVTVPVSPGVMFYPEARFQFSAGDVNSLGGNDGLPDPEDTDSEGRLQLLSVQLPVIMELPEARAWLGIDAPFQYSLSESTYFLYLKLSFGWMATERSALSLSATKFVAGQPRLNVAVQIRYSIFLR